METLRPTEPLHLHGVVLIPIQRVRIEPVHGACGACVYASAAPRAVVVGERGRWWAFDSDGKELALELLLEEVAGLADVVERERGSHA